MGLNSKYLIQSDLQSHFVDKDSGLPLQAGKVTFYKDSARTTPKDVFILDKLPPYNDNSYTNIGNQVTLGPGGNIMYDNNDVILYYYPYDDSGNIELYYVTIDNSSDVRQKTLEAWPNTTGSGSGDTQDVKNYIPNGQFFVHADIPASGSDAEGLLTETSTELAAGGWYYSQSAMNTATRYATFVQIPSDTGEPSGAARWWLRTQMTVAGVDPGVVNQFLVRFRNVNQFSSTTQSYTFAMTSKNNLSGSVPVDLATYKDFGTGGSPSAPVTTQITTFNVSSTAGIQQFSFSFGSNSGLNVGTNNDDFLDIIIQLPPDTPYDLQFTDFMLVPNEVTVIEYPQTTIAQTMAQSVAGWMTLPNPNGNDLYLVPRLTKEGMIWDDSEIGDIIAESQYNNDFTGSLSNSTNKMLADGSKYIVSEYSAIGIPYNRLFQKYLNSSIQAPIYGTGSNYFTATYPATNVFRLVNNAAGAVTATSDGTATTGFTFTVVHAGTTTNFVKAVMVDTAEFYIINNTAGAVSTAAETGNAAFTPITVVQTGNTLVPEIVSITCPAGSSVVAGSTGAPNHYISFYPVGGATTEYYFWYKVDGSGTDPLVGSATGVQVNIASTDSAAIVAQKTREALNAWNDTQISTVAASAMAAGDYFLASATGGNYYVWYTIDGAGTDPALSSKTGIEVPILSTDTSTQVAQKTQLKINSYSFAVPDLRGYFLRGLDGGADNDPDAANRWSLVPDIIGDMLGTYELPENLSHIHDNSLHITSWGNLEDTGQGYSGNNTGPPGTMTMLPEGGKESRPLNAYVRYVIRY